VTNTGPSTVNGDLGVSPGTAVTGFPPGTVNGNLHAADAVAGQAQLDLTTAYNDAAGRTPPAAVTADLGGQRLTSGVYNSATSLGLTGALTLDAQGDPNAVFVFQAGSTLTTASGSHVNLVNGAQACNVFWQIGSSATRTELVTEGRLDQCPQHGSVRDALANRREPRCPSGHHLPVHLGPYAPGGPYALATSDRSDVLQEFDGGPGQIALHGLDNLGRPARHRRVTRLYSSRRQCDRLARGAHRTRSAGNNPITHVVFVEVGRPVQLANRAPAGVGASLGSAQSPESSSLRLSSATEPTSRNSPVGLTPDSGKLDGQARFLVSNRILCGSASSARRISQAVAPPGANWRWRQAALEPGHGSARP
jgi:Ice-binding-like